MPRGIDLEIPSRHEPERAVPFSDGDGRVNGFLLDTNVVSELTKEAPDSRVVAFLATQDDLWLPTIVLHDWSSV